MNEQRVKYVKSLYGDRYSNVIAEFTDIIDYLERIGENELADKLWSEKELFKSDYHKHKEW